MVNTTTTISVEKPNFFIVGAPKCATTSLHRYLKSHPEVFMPEVKELHFFGKDIRSKIPYAAQSQDEYLSLFSDTGVFPMRGEASVYYIYSDYAAEEMKKFCPNAKIIIMLREPVELIYSLHYQHVFNKWCSDPDFETDLQLQEQELGTDEEKIHYRSLVKKLPQNIRRFQELFGSENIKIILMEDFRQDTPGVYREVLDFLGIDMTYRPKDFKTYNTNKVARVGLLGKLFGQGSGATAKARDFMWKNPRIYQLLYKIRYFLFFQLNAKESDRPRMNPKIKHKLEQEFLPTIKELEKILNRDLSHWYISDC